MVLVTRKTASRDSDYNARFREIIDAEFPGLEGRQDPQNLVHLDGGDFSHGEKAVELARRFGVKLMPWQREQVMLSLAVNRDGHWLHSDVVLICPRQNGKSLILEVVMLYRLFILNQQIVFTAQQWKTAKSIRNRMWKRIKSRAWAARRLVRNTASAGEAEMETDGGGKVQYTTRSNDAGRGFDRIDLLLIDEAYNLDSGELDAMAPTQLASPDPQTFYTSSAVNQDNHLKGEELSKMRSYALGEDAAGILFAEFAAPEGLPPEDPETWKFANPSYGVVADEKKIRSIRNKLTDTSFAVEMLGWGNWFQLDGDAEDATLVDLGEWSSRVADPPDGWSSCALGVDVTPDAEHVGMVSAVEVDDVLYLSLAPVHKFTRSEVVGMASRTVDLHDPVAVVLDPTGACSTLVDPLEGEGIGPELLNGTQVSKAYELLMRLWAEGRVRHDGDPRWGEAWSVAEERSKAGRYRSFERYSGDVSALVAASFAVWALQEFSIPDEVPESVKMKRFTGRAVSVPPQGGQSSVLSVARSDF